MISRLASRTPAAPRAGSMLANRDHHVGVLGREAPGDLEVVRNRLLARLGHAVDRESDAGQVALAVVVG